MNSGVITLEIKKEGRIIVLETRKVIDGKTIIVNGLADGKRPLQKEELPSKNSNTEEDIQTKTKSMKKELEKWFLEKEEEL